MPLLRVGSLYRMPTAYLLRSLGIADVSVGSPNVMYELGLRHITGNPKIHIGEAGQLPFDIASIRTIRCQRVCCCGGYADSLASR